MSIYEAERRFTWIHLYCDAVRWAISNELTNGSYDRILYVQDLIYAAVDWWVSALQHDTDLRRWIAVKRGHGCYFSPLLSGDFCYLYDLESELWGTNWHLYINRRSVNDGVTLEPFRMVLLFYLVERAMKLLLAHLRFLDYERNDITHSAIRERAFEALFGHHQMARWMPFPLNLTALTTRVDHGGTDFDHHRSCGFVGNHFSVVGKQHYVDLLESTLCQAAKWQRKRHTTQNHRPPRGSIRGFFFDCLWHYSESYRYRVPLASAYVRNNPFHWGLNMRWLGTIFITVVELWLYTISASAMRTIWETYCQKTTSPIFQGVQQYRWRYIQEQRPQTLI